MAVPIKSVTQITVVKCVAPSNSERGQEVSMQNALLSILRPGTSAFLSTMALIFSGSNDLLFLDLPYIYWITEQNQA